jgi:hypothetical protein
MQKSAQFNGSLFLFATLLQKPFPCLSLGNSLMLLGKVFQKGNAPHQHHLGA